jgi:hypothetical protein
LAQVKALGALLVFLVYWKWVRFFGTDFPSEIRPGETKKKRFHRVNSACSSGNFTPVPFSEAKGRAGQARFGKIEECSSESRVRFSAALSIPEFKTPHFTSPSGGG